jgi:YVTN family beta-propeller protein
MAFPSHVFNSRSRLFSLSHRLSHVFCILAVLFGIALFSATSSQQVQARQNIPVIKYGQTVKGTIGNTSTNDAVLYSFQARVGDTVGIRMVRTSSTLRPFAGILDQSLPKGKQVLATSDLSSDGKTATISSFSITKSGQYQIVATRENVDQGTTSGNFTLTLTNTIPTPTPEPTIEPTAADTSAAGTHTFTVGTEPSYSVWSGNNLYVANQGDGTVSILDGEGTLTGTIKTGGAPFAMSWDGARLWVADFGTDQKPGNSVTLFDSTGKKLNTYKVGKQPISLSYDSDDLLTWIALYGDDKIVAVDAHGKIVHTVDVSDSGHNPNTVLWTSTQLWVTLQGTDQAPDNKVLNIDATGAILNTITVGQLPADLAWDDADQIVFVANNADGTITAINAADGSIISTYKVGTSPSALAWDGTHLWATLATENTVAVLDKSGNIITKVPLDDIPNGITYDGLSSVWVALPGSVDHPGSTIVQIDINVTQ